VQNLHREITRGDCFSRTHEVHDWFGDPGVHEPVGDPEPKQDRNEHRGRAAEKRQPGTVHDARIQALDGQPIEYR
jgi:hypothetical protein